MARKLVRKLTGRATAEPPDDDDGGDGQPRVSRRKYLLLTGTGMAAVAGQTGDNSGVVSAKTTDTTTVSAPDTYGYGGGSVLSQSTSPQITAQRPLGDHTRENLDSEITTTAEELPSDTTVNNTLPADSSRWYALEVTGGEDLLVDFQRSDPDGITALVLYDADGSFRSLRYAASDAPVQLLDTIEAGGTVFLQTVDVQNGDGDYTLTASIGETTGNVEEGDEYTDFEEEVTDEPTEQSIRIVAAGDESANYEFTVSGELKPGEYFPDGSWEEIDGSTVNGWVSDTADVGYDDFRFTGDIEAFELLEGDADVFVDDEPWSPAEREDTDGENDTTVDTELLERRLVIISTGEDSAHYNFTVTDTLRGGDQFPDGSWESITGNTADGWVSNDADITYDSFYYRGEIESFSLLEGDAELRVDGETVEIDSDGLVETPTPTDTSEVDENLGTQGYGMYEYGGISS